MVLLGCQSTNISNVKFYAEIPFMDCPEGVFVESVTHKTGLIKCEEWAKMRPLMVMIDPIGKKEIFGQWSEACRWAGKDCNVKMKSVKSTIDAIDKIAESILKK